MNTTERNIERAKQGSEVAWRDLLEPLQAPVTAYLARFVQPSDALDIAQETWVRVIRSIHQFEGRSSFKSWVFRIAYRQMLNHQKRKPKTDSLAVDVAGEDAAIETKLEQVEAQSQLLECVDRLPEHQRQVVWLRLSEGLTFREIAEVLDAPLNTILGRMHQAKQQLTKAMIKKGIITGAAT